jgi:hypothetical protein
MKQWKPLSVALCALVALAGRSGAAWEAVPPVDFGKFGVEDFVDDELEIAPALFHFHTVANSVVESGPTRGFIGIKVWRDAKDNEPYNARILENHVAFAFFYTQKRKWNPYRGSAGVKERLEAILDFWVRSQNEAGLFSEYGPTNFSLAPTSFGVRHMALTLEMLEESARSGGPGIDPELLERVKRAQRKAMVALVGTDEWLMKGRHWSNQYSPVYFAVLSYDRLYGDKELLGMLLARLPQVRKEHQSPAGYLYEAAGPDHGYTFGTHVMNARIAWPLAKGGPVGEFLVEELKDLFEWGVYNYVREPDDSGFYTNFGISSRTGQRYVKRLRLPMADRVPGSTALVDSDVEKAAEVAARRAALAGQWGTFRPLAVGASQAYPPTAFTDVDRVKNFATAAERQEAVGKLPYMAGRNFNRQFVDSLTKFDFQFTFVRRAGYYASFNAAKEGIGPQRFGLGIVWNDAMGAVLQTQTGLVEGGRADFSYGTVAAGADAPYEAKGAVVEYLVGGAKVMPKVGKTELADGDLLVRYVGNEKLKKSVRFTDNAIVVEVEHAGAFVEQLPLLGMETDEAVLSRESVVVTRQVGGKPVKMVIRLEGASGEPAVKPGAMVGGKVLRSVRVPATGRLRYVISFE